MAAGKGVLLMAYGAPERLDQVESYYLDIRRGSPPPAALLAELVDRYRAIGGGSPLSRIVERQRTALEAELGRRGLRVAVYAGMKHISPFIRDVVTRMADDGIRQAIALALAPQHSTFNAQTYIGAVEHAASSLGPRAPQFSFIESWHDQPRLIAALAGVTAEALSRFPPSARPHVFFTAHSLPERIAHGGDPYAREVAATAALVAELLELTRCDVAFQSAGRTAEAWIGPELGAELRRVAAAGVREVVVCPVGFVADHLEVLYDVDIEAQRIARDLGIRLERARSMNDDPIFIAGLADLVESALRQPIPA